MKTGYAKSRKGEKLMESMLVGGDPDGTRKRPPPFYINSLPPCAVMDQRLTDTGVRRNDSESTRLDRKLDTGYTPFRWIYLWGGVLLLSGCAMQEIGHQCPRIVPESAYNRLLTLSTVHLVEPRLLGQSCPAEALACSRPVVQASQVLAADVYLPEGDPAFQQSLLFHEVCHLYEIDSGAKTVAETSAHEGWLRYTR